MLRTLGLLMVVLSTRASSPAAQELPRRKLLPRDESRTVPSFARFAARLRKAAEQGDVRTLRDVLAPDVMLDFEPATPDAVLRAFDVTEGSPWRALRTALTLGVVREEEEGMFVAPYVSGPTPVEIDILELVVTGANVQVRDRPDRTARIIGHLSYDIVARGPEDKSDQELFNANDAPDGPAAWVQIVTPSGASGYLYGAFVRSPISWRFHFRRVNGVWKIVFVTAGD